MFEFDGARISRVERLIRLFRDEVLTATPKEIAERYLEAVSAFYANPDSSEKLATVMAMFFETVDWNIDGDTAPVPYIGPRRGKAEVALLPNRSTCIWFRVECFRIAVPRSATGLRPTAKAYGPQDLLDSSDNGPGQPWTGGYRCSEP
ncbi:hypothetical protein QBK99_20735 [Corticibacterium sp. UT-5YL-CI-8]|nr:hypothetical protein [Tianweitania sp. UT-5YL-CI-8]